MLYCVQAGIAPVASEREYRGARPAQQPSEPHQILSSRLQAEYVPDSARAPCRGDEPPRVAKAANEESRRFSAENIDYADFYRSQCPGGRCPCTLCVREKISPADLVTAVVTLPSIAERPASSEERQLICPRAVQGYLEDGHGLYGMVAAGAAARAGAVAALDVNERAKMATFKAEAVAAGPTAFVLQVGSFSKRSVELTMQDFMSIRNRRWVTDRVVNGYVYLLEQRANRRASTSRAVVSFMSFFYNRLVGEDKIEGDPNPGEFYFRPTERWTKRLDKVQRLCLSRWILVPVNVGRMHCALAVLDFRSKTITYYDSLFDSERSSRVLATLMRWLREYAAMDAAANGGQPAIDVSEWTSVSPGRSVPVVRNTQAYP
jgi:hypothetical protein